MRPGFGAQTVEFHAERMKEDPLWILRWIWYQKTGTPPVSFDDFTPQQITPFFLGLEDAIAQEDNSSLSPTRWGPPRKLKIPTSWEEPIKTGDPLIDKWEREIASGQTPNLAEGLSP